MESFKSGPILSIHDLTSGYTNKVILNGVTLSVHPGELIGMIGLNGAGKSTLLKTIVGLVKPWDGQIIFDGVDISGKSIYERVKSGIGYLAQESPIFSDFSVLDNLERALTHGRRSLPIPTERERIFELFPRLREKAKTRAGLLSGGEKQLLALAMVFAVGQKFILLDEPSAGMAFHLLDQIMELIIKIRDETGTSMMIVEQNIRALMKICDRAYLMKQGEITKEVKERKHLTDEEIDHLLFDERDSGDQPSI